MNKLKKFAVKFKNFLMGRLFFNILKICFLIIFSFYFYKFSVEVFNYSIGKIKDRGVSFENLKIVPGKVLKISFSGIKYKKDGVFFYGRNGKVVIDVLDSVRELKPVFNDVELGSFKVIVEEGEKKKNKNFEIPDIRGLRLPFSISFKKIDIGRGEVQFNNGNFHFNGLSYKNRQFILNPLQLNLNGKGYAFSQITGEIKDERFSISRFTVDSDYGKVNVKAKGDIYFESVNVTASGRLDGYRFEVAFDKNLSNLLLKGFLELPQISDKVLFDIKTHVSKAVSISGTAHTYKENLKSEFDGEISGEKIDISGFLKGDFRFNEFQMKNLNGKYRLVGDVIAPDFIFEGESNSFSVQNEEILNLKVSLNLRQFDRLNGTLSFKKGGVFNLSLNGSVRRKEFLFSGDVKKFDFKNGFLKEAFSQEILDWIPDVKGDAAFNGEFIRNKLEKFQATLLADRFYFRGFEGKCRLKTFLLSDNKLSINGTIQSPEGMVLLSGSTDIGSKTLNLNVNVKEFSISSLDFLSKEGLSGVVNGEGTVKGKFASLSGAFRFYSPKFAYFGEKFSDINVELVFSYPSLFIKAKSEDGRVNVSKVAIDFFPHFSIEVTGNVKNFHLSTVEEILSRYKVENPLKLTGVASGDFNVLFRGHEENPFKMNINIVNFDGFYELSSVFSGNATGKGTVSFDRHLTVDITGESKDVFLSTIPFKKGKFHLIFEDTQLKLSGNGFSLSLVDTSKVNFDAVIDINEKKIGADFKMEGEKEISPFKAIFSLSGKVAGTFDSFKIPVSGELKVESDYLLDGYEFSFSGELVEPQNTGKFIVSSQNGAIELSIKDKILNLNGDLKDLTLKSDRGKVSVGLAFINLSVPDFDFTRINGDVNVPVLSFIPDDKNLPVIHSSTGVYATIEGVKVSVSDSGFTFNGGWLEVKDFFFDGKEVKGKFEGSFNGKKLVEVGKLQDTLNIISGEIGVSGRLKYDFENEKLNYILSVISDRLEMRVKYVLAKLMLNNVSIGVEDGKLQYLFAGVSAGGGNIVVSGKEKISLSAFNIPIGEPGAWRARVTGNLNYDNGMVKGAVTVSRPVILKLGEKKEGNSGISLPFNADIVINFSEPLILRSQLWEVKVLPALKFTVKDSVPAVSGNFFVLGGKIKYMGKEFQIDYGSGVIENLLDLKGTINIASTARIGDYYIYMFVRGNFASPVLYFSSEPPLSKEQILSLLITGATPSDMERSNEIFPVVQVAYYASSFLLKPFEKQFTKFLKLESFVVEPYITKYGETVFKLSLSKRIGSRLRIIGYQTTGQDPEFSIGLQYFVGRYKNFYLEYLYSNYYANEYGIGFNVRFDDWEDLKKMRLRK